MPTPWGCERTPTNLGPRHGKSLYKPYNTWVFMGYNPQESLENTINTMDTLLGSVRGTPNCPLTHTLGRYLRLPHSPPQRKKFRNRNFWWRVRGIFQGYVGEILDTWFIYNRINVYINVYWYTLKLTAKALEKWWLEDCFPLGPCLFSEAMLVSGRVIVCSILSESWINVLFKTCVHKSKHILYEVLSK